MLSEKMKEEKIKLMLTVKYYKDKLDKARYRLRFEKCRAEVYNNRYQIRDRDLPSFELYIDIKCKYDIACASLHSWNKAMEMVQKEMEGLL